MITPGVLTCNLEEDGYGSHITMWLYDLQLSMGLQYIMQLYIAPEGYDVFYVRKCRRGLRPIQEIS